MVDVSLQGEIECYTNKQFKGKGQAKKRLILHTKLGSRFSWGRERQGGEIFGNIIGT